MRNNNNNKFCKSLGLLLFVFIFFGTRCFATDYQPTYKESFDLALSWFHDPNHSLEKWSFNEKLGAAEFLYFSLLSNENYYSQKGRIDTILSSLLHTEGKSDPNIYGDANNRLKYIRPLVLSISIKNSFGKEFNRIAKSLCKMDPNNGVSWIFQAEYKFAKGNPWSGVKLLQKALDCPEFSFRDAFAKDNIARALKKAGFYNKNMKHFLIVEYGGDRVYTIAFRHALLLSNLYFMHEHFGIKSEDFPVHIFPARQYLSYLSCNLTAGDRFGLIVACINMNKHQQLYWISPQVKTIISQMPLIQKELSLLEDSYRSIVKKRMAIEEFARNASSEELDVYLDNPDLWWKNNKPSKDSDKTPPTYQTWRTFWADFQATIDKSNMPIPPEQPDEFQPGNFPPGMWPGLCP